MKRVLVIDDEKSFDFPAYWDVVYARNLNLGFGYAFLWRGDWDEIWLDHDLGDGDEGEETIRPLVLRFAEQAFNGDAYPVGEFVICSLNVPGQKWIESTLSPYYKVSLCTSPRQLKERIGSSVAKWY